jgi:hypothetical protein
MMRMLRPGHDRASTAAYDPISVAVPPARRANSAAATAGRRPRSKPVLSIGRKTATSTSASSGDPTGGQRPTSPLPGDRRTGRPVILGDVVDAYHWLGHPAVSRFPQVNEPTSHAQDGATQAGSSTARTRAHRPNSARRSQDPWRASSGPRRRQRSLHLFPPATSTIGSSRKRRIGVSGPFIPPLGALQ